MGLKELFDTNAPRSQRQDNWLRMVEAIPEVKSAFNDAVTAEDGAVAAEAQSILENSEHFTRRR